jgi:hypothetical protein
MQVQWDPRPSLEGGDDITYLFDVPNHVPYGPDRVIVQINSLFDKKYMNGGFVVILWSQAGEVQGITKTLTEDVWHVKTKYYGLIRRSAVSQEAHLVPFIWWIAGADVCFQFLH